MRINNNLMAMNTLRQYSVNTANSAASTERLSSGYRINRAGDDAAGLAISEKMRAQIRGLSMASKNSQDAISLVQTAEGALNETHSILQRMRELAVQSSSDTNDGSFGDGAVTVDRAALNEEFQALKAEINDIADKTAFNGKKLLQGGFGKTSSVDTVNSTISEGNDGITSIMVSGFDADDTVSIVYDDSVADHETYSVTRGGQTIAIEENTIAANNGTLSFNFNDGASVTIKGTSAAGAWEGDVEVDVAGSAAVIQTGANQGDTMEIEISAMSAGQLSLGVVNSNDDGEHIASRDSASLAITNVNTAINTVSTERSKLGAYQNRLQHKINNLDTTSENLSAAESRIRDLDMAKEMTTHTKNNILVQAATAMLAQANSAPQGVLQLLQ